MKTKWSVGLAVLMALNIARADQPGARLPGSEVVWLDNVETALNLARREDRFVMVYFTGSDWCSWCRKLDREVLNTTAFQTFMQDYLVPVKLEFPKQAPLLPLQEKYNKSIAERYRVKSYPTLIFFDSNGQELNRRVYEEGGAEKYINSTLARLKMVAPVSLSRRESKVTSRAEDLQARRGAPPPLFGGAATAPPPRYTNLVLKSITGTGNRRLALVNNQTLGIGETASVKLEDRNVRVRCTEIRERSVVVKVEGETEPREVRLAGPE